MEYYYDYYYRGDPFSEIAPGASALAGFLGVLFTVLLILLIVLLIWSVVSYIFTGISLYQMAKKRNFKYAWLAWIPIANGYLVGALINDQVKIGSLKIPRAAIVMPLVTAASAVLTVLLTGIPFVGWLLMLFLLVAESIYTYAAYYRLYKIYNAKNAVLYTVLTVIIPFLSPFFVFSLRHKIPDYTDIDPLTDDPVNPRSVLALGFGILAVVNACLQSALGALAIVYGPVTLGAIAILFGILSLREQRVHHQSIVLPVAGLILGSLGILMAFILPIAGLTLWHGIYENGGGLQNYLQHDTSPYPFT